MEQQKQMLYDFQLLSLQNGKPGFSTTTDLYVRSGQIPPYNSSMSNEQIANYVSDYIVKNWNQMDIQRAVNDAQNAIPSLQRQYEPIKNRKHTEFQSSQQKTEYKQRETDFLMMHNFLHNSEEGIELLKILKKSFKKNDDEVLVIITNWANSKFPRDNKQKIIDRYFDYYLSNLKPYFIRQDQENQTRQRRINKCRYCNRQKNGRFDTCCKACINGSHTTDCDMRNGRNPTYTKTSEEPQQPRETQNSSETEREQRRQANTEYRNRQRETYYQNMNNEPNISNQQHTNTGVRFEEDVLNCPSVSKYPKNCTSRKDYLNQAKIFHPDKNPGCTGTATQKFQVLQTICKDYKGGKRKGRKTNKKRTRKNKSRKFRK